jgi:hypothetical protein
MNNGSTLWSRGGLSEPIVALQNLSCKHSAAWHEHLSQQIMCYVLCLPPYIYPCHSVKSLCKAQWLFFCFYLFSLFPLPCIPFKSLQRLMQKYHFSFFQSFFIFRWLNHVFTLCMSSLCCLAGSYCVLGPQRWPQSCSNFTVSSAASVKGVYKVIGSLLSCCNLWCKTQKETIEG